MFLPINYLYGKDVLQLPPFTEDSVVVIFPGYGGNDPHIDRLIDSIKQSDKIHNRERFVYRYDWEDWRGNILRASHDIEKIGEIVGKQLGDLSWQREDEGKPAIKSIHVIGISAGSFAADKLLKEYRKKLSKKLNWQYRQMRRKKKLPEGILERSEWVQNEVLQRTFMRLTLLDPFQSRGLLEFSYGKKMFGSVADFCEQFLNTDDPVPFTNDILPHCHTYDITSSKRREKFEPLPGDNMHSWPTAFYSMYWLSEIDPALNNDNFSDSHQIKPKRKTTFIE